MERRVFLSSAWLGIVLAVGVATFVSGAGDTRFRTALGMLTVAAATMLIVALRAPHRTPAAVRLVSRAGEPWKAGAAKLFEQMTDEHPFGTDDPELARIGEDPMAVATHGPAIAWAAAPALAASFGFLPPKPRSGSGAAVWDTPAWWGLAGGAASSLGGTGWVGGGSEGVAGEGCD